MHLSRILLSACLKVLAALCFFITALFVVWALVYRLRDGLSDYLMMQIVAIIGFAVAGFVCRHVAGRVAPEG